MDDGSKQLHTIFNGSYKLLVKPNAVDGLYHLTFDPYKTDNLISSGMDAQATAAKMALEATLININE